MLVGILASTFAYFWYDNRKRERAEKQARQLKQEEKARREAAYRKRNTKVSIYKPHAPFRTVAAPRVGTSVTLGEQSSDKVFSGTDNPHLLLQDCSRPLSRHLASKPDARMHVRDVAAEIRGQMIDRFTEVV